MIYRPFQNHFTNQLKAPPRTATYCKAGALARDWGNSLATRERILLMYVALLGHLRRYTTLRSRTRGKAYLLGIDSFLPLRPVKRLVPGKIQACKRVAPG